jgi:hypothetical protein
MTLRRILEHAQPLSQQSIDAQMSTPRTSSISFHSTLSPFDPASTLRQTDESVFSDQSSDESDEEEYETIASPPKAVLIQLPSPSSLPSPVISSLTNTPAQPYGETNRSSAAKTTNPFEKLILDRQKSPEEQSTSTDVSSPISSPSPLPQAVDPRSYWAMESSRLETFKRAKLETFADVDVRELAYAGFYLDASSKTLKCPWCDVELSEKHYLTIVKERPTVTYSVLSDDPWTPMRVHRHVNGTMVDAAHHWCTWVRREATSLYPNIVLVRGDDVARTHSCCLFILARKLHALS